MSGTLPDIDDHELGQLQDALQPLFGERDFSARGYLSGQKIDERCKAIQRLFKLTAELQLFNFAGDLSWVSKTTNVPPVSKTGLLGKAILSLKEVGL